ncbi:MAG: type II toxin-antitoxin system VapC family toxin, partial [Thermoplasmatales archaeon]|nr:type II toxin-antitoxin system VapC family toxin [Thermoplasmatales archaeon]
MYIDSNIFIFASTDKGKLGQNCRGIIRRINEQKIACAASFLVVDEVMWILKKNVGRDDAIKITKAMLSMPIKWVEVDKSVIIKMIDIFEKTTLDPRDAIHIASMKELGLS